MSWAKTFWERHEALIREGQISPEDLPTKLLPQNEGKQYHNTFSCKLSGGVFSCLGGKSLSLSEKLLDSELSFGADSEKNTSISYASSLIAYLDADYG